MGALLDEDVEYLVGDLLDLGALDVVDEPLEDLLLVGQIAAVQAGHAVLQVEQRRQLVDAVLLGLGVVVDLDEGHRPLVALVVDVLQFRQDAQRFGVVSVIWPAPTDVG